MAVKVSAKPKKVAPMSLKDGRVKSGRMEVGITLEVEDSDGNQILLSVPEAKVLYHALKEYFETK